MIGVDTGLGFFLLVKIGMILFVVYEVTHIPHPFSWVKDGFSRSAVKRN
jgi:hypothetical protein